MSLQAQLTAVLQAIGADMKTALAGGGGGGTTITFFQVQDNGSTGQLTTGSAVDLAGMWDTPDLTDSNFTWNGSTGELTINAAGTLEVDCTVSSWNNLNNRHELHVQLMHDSGGGYVKVMEASNYSSRNNTQDEGDTQINGFKILVAAGDKIKLRVFDIGVAATVGSSNVAGQTYLSVKLYV